MELPIHYQLTPKFKKKKRLFYKSRDTEMHKKNCKLRNAYISWIKEKRIFTMETNLCDALKPIFHFFFFFLTFSIIILIIFTSKLNDLKQTQEGNM